jgi:hypothetical protein
MEKINQLRIAEICMDEQKMLNIAQEIVALNRKFEREDDPHGN